MSERADILGVIGQRVHGHIAHPGPGPRLARTMGDRAHCVNLFVEKAKAAAATVAKANDVAEIPALVAAYLRENNLPPKIRVSPDRRVSGLDWSKQPLIEIGVGAADPSDDVSLTPAMAGLAETGTLVLASSAETPNSLNFLPETHIVVVAETDVLAGFENLWSKARADFAAGWPRSLNLVTGPSRSADIEQTLLMGAHGPKRLHIILVHG